MSISKPSHGIAVDIDGIVLDSPRLMWQAITNHLELPWSIDAWKSYNIEEILGVTTKELRPIYEPILYMPDLPLIKGSAETLQWLHSQYPDEELLFITSRRPQFKQPAIDSIRAGLGPSIPFKVECVEEIDKEFEARNNKLPMLQHYGITWYFEDNAMYWQKYIDAGIHISTLLLPWTMKPAENIRGNNFSMFSDWYAILYWFKNNTNLAWERRHKYGNSAT